MDDHPQQHRTKRILKIAAFMLAGIIIVGWIFNSALEILFIPDSCYFHAREEQAGTIVNLMFDFKASEGFHPTPSLLNVALSSVLGGILGLVFGIKRTKK